jgi:hypothetical protein
MTSPESINIHIPTVGKDTVFRPDSESGMVTSDWARKFRNDPGFTVSPGFVVADFNLALLHDVDAVFVPFSIDGQHKQPLHTYTVRTIEEAIQRDIPIYAEVALEEQYRLSDGQVHSPYISDRMPGYGLTASRIARDYSTAHLNELNSRFAAKVESIGEIVVGNDIELIKGVKV